MSIELLGTEKLEKAATMLKVMAHPIRLAIIDLLGVNSKMNVTEIYEALSIEQAAASHHLTLLKSKGLLSSERDGKNCVYFLKHDRITQIVSCIEKCN
jgi:DNA-binding transcriptional ArsR family regulator